MTGISLGMGEKPIYTIDEQFLFSTLTTFDIVNNSNFDIKARNLAHYIEEELTRKGYIEISAYKELAGPKEFERNCGPIATSFWIYIQPYSDTITYNRRRSYEIDKINASKIEIKEHGGQEKDYVSGAVIMVEAMDKNGKKMLVWSASEIQEKQESNKDFVKRILKTFPNQEIDYM